MTITGAFAGAGIQYVIPATLVWLARRRLAQLEGEVVVMMMPLLLKLVLLTIMGSLAADKDADADLSPNIDGTQ